jgi:hypothetical protein
MECTDGWTEIGSGEEGPGSVAWGSTDDLG